MPTAVEHDLSHLETTGWSPFEDLHDGLADGSVRPGSGNLYQDITALMRELKPGSVDHITLAKTHRSLIGVKNDGGGLAILIGLLQPAQDHHALTHALNMLLPYLAPNAELALAGFQWGGTFKPRGFTGGVHTIPAVQ